MNYVHQRSTGSSKYIAKLTLSKVAEKDELEDRYIGVMIDITQLKQYQAELEKIVHFDSLTGLPNNVLFKKELEEEIAEAAEHQSNITIFYIDLDGFKNINDTYGHAVGEQFLVETSHTMAAVLKESALLARIGGMSL